ncbi:YecH family protein [Shewanella maritima]|uniref:YecH family protein n=1 Tax=Shewanella maritima TaxID=2520507 RepID=UPI0037352415
MSKSIHGRNVINLMKTHTPQPREQWLALMAQEFGQDAQFHTCQASDMTAEQLFELFVGNGRLSDSAEGYTINQCGHCAGKEGHNHA